MLELAAVNAYYGDSHILHGIDLALGSGDAVALIGRNGTGKSTLLKSIMAAGPRVLGAVRFDGHDLDSTPSHVRARMGLGFVPEDRRIFAALTIEENLEMARMAAGSRGARAPDEIIGMFPMLQKLRGRLGYQLSGGEQQLLAVARALVARPRVILLDEPTEGLAPIIVDELATHINELRALDGAALLLAEQNLHFSRLCTQRIDVIDAGAIVFSGTWDAFDAQPDITTRHLAI